MTQGQEQGQQPAAGQRAGAEAASKPLPPRPASADEQPAAAPATLPAPPHSHGHSKPQHKNTNAGGAAEEAEEASMMGSGAAATAQPQSPPSPQLLSQQGALTANNSASLLVQPLSPRTLSRQRQKQQQVQVEQPTAAPIYGTSKQRGAAIEAPAAVAGALPKRSTQQQQKGQQQAQVQPPATGPVSAPHPHERNTRQRQHQACVPGNVPDAIAAAAAAGASLAGAVSQQLQPEVHKAHQQQDNAASLAAGPLPHEQKHNTRHTQRKCEELARRSVSFAQGPWAGKFATADGHPNHEGQLARQRRSAGMGWGRDLTPSAVRAVEAELGEDCRPSIDRLKRRVGLLPLRKRSLEYYTLINGTGSGAPAAAGRAAAAAAANSLTSMGAGGGGSSQGGEPAGDPRSKKPRCGQCTAAAIPAKQQQPGPAAEAAANGKLRAHQPAYLMLKSQQQQQQHGSVGSMPHKLAPEAELPPPAVTFSRKRAQAEMGVPSQQEQKQQNGGAASSKRASQRLGGLSGPVGSLGSFGKHAATSSS